MKGAAKDSFSSHLSDLKNLTRDLEKTFNSPTSIMMKRKKITKEIESVTLRNFTFISTSMLHNRFDLFALSEKKLREEKIKLHSRHDDAS